MCGIYGYVTSGGTVDAGILQAMGDCLKHRGPDDSGEVVRNVGRFSVGLGHKRLSIIDLSIGGRQPIANEDETIWITFNGEIYNFKELRDELKKNGHRFKSRTDSEVVVHLYEELGTACLNRLNGMFAFALWDERKRTLFLARDRMGKKPLHYCLQKNQLIFASEIKALLRHPAVDRRLSFKSLDKYLSYEYIPAPESIFSSVKKLEPGHYLLYRNDEAVSAQY
jgi:asparagine synthase (glutamine-hydrolysing)